MIDANLRWVGFSTVDEPSRPSALGYGMLAPELLQESFACYDPCIRLPAIAIPSYVGRSGEDAPQHLHIDIPKVQLDLPNDLTLSASNAI